MHANFLWRLCWQWLKQITTLFFISVIAIMSGKKTGKVAVLENAFELNLAKLLKASKKLGVTTVTVDGHGLSGLVSLAQDKLTVLIDGGAFSAAIAMVPCLNGRSRPLLKCPRAHEGNFQSLYYRGGILACRLCHKLKYQSNLAGGPSDRARLARFKLLDKLNGEPGSVIPERKPYAWRKKHQRLSARLAGLTGLHYQSIRRWLGGKVKD
jgi:hypothetical protein